VVKIQARLYEARSRLPTVFMVETLEVGFANIEKGSGKGEKRFF